MALRWLHLGFALAAVGCSPYGGGGEFACTTDTACGADGKCSEGFCSFPDGICDSGYRYGEFAGALSNMCVGGGTGSDGSIDVPEVNEDGMSCYGTGIVRACFATPPTGTRTLNTAIDTVGSPLCDQGTGNAAWCVIAGASISVQGTVAVTGARPLVLVATGSINVAGILDLASHRGGAIGAAGDPNGCNAGTAPTVGGGGAGGSLGGSGGGGAAAAGTAGVAGATPTVNALRGGCPGQAGSGGGGGAAGHGGGGGYLIASTSIMVPGTINASGSAGINAGAASSSGGGGGGAGGFIGLEAPAVSIGGSVFANGGGGGEASGNASTGVPGNDSPDAATAGAGGSGGSAYGTDGGAGSVGATLAGTAGAAACTTPCAGAGNAGGGGGGGAGIVRVVPSQSTGGTVSPPAT